MTLRYSAIGPLDALCLNSVLLLLASVLWPETLLPLPIISIRPPQAGARAASRQWRCGDTQRPEGNRT